MNLWELHRKIQDLLTAGGNPADKPVKAYLDDEQVPVELDLISMTAGENGTSIQLKRKK